MQAKQRWKYAKIIATLSVAVLMAGAYALHEHRESRKQKALAQDLFYAMKSLDLDISNLEKIVLNSENPQAAEQIRKYQHRRKQMEDNYDKFLATFHLYRTQMTERERLVLRVARIFGECELAMPAGFTAEIDKYIQKWRSSGRLVRAIRIAKENGYTVKISAELLAHDLPPQFFYLALQESDFEPFISGPNTRKGIAKGMWQFIPETAVKYGLHLGPLVDLRRPDPADDRHREPDRDHSRPAGYS